MSRFYSVNEAADILGVDRAAIYRMQERGKFKNVERRSEYGVRGGKPRLYISEEDVEKQLELLNAPYVEPKNITEAKEKQKRLEEDYVKNPDKYDVTAYGKIIGVKKDYKEVDEIKTVEVKNDFYTDMDKIFRCGMTVSFKPDAIDGIIDEMISKMTKEQLTKYITKMMERLITV